MFKSFMLFVGLMSAVGLSACSTADADQVGRAEMDGSEKTVLLMEMDANYSPTDPFVNGLLFEVSEDVDALDAEVTYQMEGESGTVEIKERLAEDVLWRKTWKENTSEDTFAVTLKNLQKEKDYVVEFTGTQINHALVKVSFDSELVQEKARPSK